ncbi:MAG: hypothetical protein AAF533_05310 [Acidobacteriota bacterium]
MRSERGLLPDADDGTGLLSDDGCAAERTGGDELRTEPRDHRLLPPERVLPTGLLPSRLLRDRCSGASSTDRELVLSDDHGVARSDLPELTARRLSVLHALSVLPP